MGVRRLPAGRFGWKKSLVDHKIVQVAIVVSPFLAVAYGVYGLFTGKVVVIGKYARNVTYTGWEGIVAAVGYLSFGAAIILTLSGYAIKGKRFGFSVMMAGLICGLLFIGIAFFGLLRAVVS